MASKTTSTSRSTTSVTGIGSDHVKSHISKLGLDVDTETIKATLSDIREGIHTSRQFYKNFVQEFHSLDGASRLLEVLRANVADESLVDLAVSVLATCCLDKNNAEQVKELDGISVIGTILKQYSKSSTSIINRCARTLANLAKSVEMDEELDEEAVFILVQTLEDTDDGGCCHSLLRVLKMFTSSRNKTLLWNIVDCGGLRAACKILKSKDSKLVLLAVETLVALTNPFNKRKCKRNFSLPVATANPTLESDSLSNLFDLLSHHKPEVQCHAWECIDNLMSSNIGRAALGNAGFVKFYLATARKETVRLSVRERCSQYLCLCCQESVNRVKMFELDGLLFLVDLLKEDPAPLPVIPSALVVAAIAEFRYDKPALEFFAKLKLVKVFLLLLDTVIKARKEQLQQAHEDRTSSDEEVGCNKPSGRKRKSKKRQDSAKRIKMDVDCQDEAGAPTVDSPTTAPGLCALDPDGGLSPGCQTHWHPESPQMSPTGSCSGLPGASPTSHFSSGLSPVRGHLSGEASPPYSHPPTYQFPSSMMSPPKSNSTSPGSSPTYFYGPSSPQKFFGNNEELFSPVVSEASDSFSSSGETDDSADALKGAIDIKEDTVTSATGEGTVIRHQHQRHSSGATLEQATRKLSLSKEKESEVEILPVAADSTKATPHASSTAKHPVKKNVCSSHFAPTEASSKRGTHKNLPSGSDSKAPHLKPSSPLKLPVPSVPSSPRVSLGDDTDSIDGDRTPTKDATRVPKQREEEENIVLVLQELILLRHVPAINYITTSHSVQTLTFLATSGVVASERYHLLLKNVFSSRFYYQKLVVHSIPCLIYKSLSWLDKQHEKTLGSEDPQDRGLRRPSLSNQEPNIPQISKCLQYLRQMQEIAETSFGQKEVEHLLRSHHAKQQLGASLSVPYLYRCGPVLRHLLVDCEALHILLRQYRSPLSSEVMSKVARSLCRASRSLLPPWKRFCQRHFETEGALGGDEAPSETAVPGGGSEGRQDECFYKAQENSADLTLICEGEEEVRANRQVLAARSEYFACLLTGGFQEARQQSVRLEGMRARSLLCFLHSLYDCHPDHCATLSSISKESLDSLLDMIATAKFYMTAGGRQGVEGDPEYCPLERTVTGVILKLKLCDYTVSGLVRFAVLHHCQKFLDCCLLFILRDRAHLRKHLGHLLTSDSRDQISQCVVELFRNSKIS